MAVENVQVMHEFSPDQLRMGTVRLKQNKETEEEWKIKKSMSTKKGKLRRSNCRVGLWPMGVYNIV